MSKLWYIIIIIILIQFNGTISNNFNDFRVEIKDLYNINYIDRYKYPNKNDTYGSYKGILNDTNKWMSALNINTKIAFYIKYINSSYNISMIRNNIIECNKNIKTCNNIYHNINDTKNNIIIKSKKCNVLLYFKNKLFHFKYGLYNYYNGYILVSTNMFIIKELYNNTIY